MELRGGKKSIFEEMALQYKQYIDFGVVADGERLPSCRELAIRLGINPNTVERAYALLESEGYAVTLPKKGTYAVANRSKAGGKLKEATSVLTNLKLAGVTYNELVELLKTIYEED